tara:strand:- start:32375 stop:33046 length:672 start_codon:yes stop_codon:yes gene_type:complete
MLQKAELIVFDLDDTLAPWHEYARSGFMAVDAWLQAQEGVVGFMVKVWALFEAGVRGNTMDRAFDALGLPEDEKRNQQALSIYRSHEPSLELFPDVASVLTQLKKDYKLGVITDGLWSIQERKASVLGLGKWMGKVICTDKLTPPSPKPDAKAFKLMMAHANVPGEACIYVGDNPSKDFFAPKALGWKTIRIRRNGMEYTDSEALSSEYEADEEIQSLEALIH